MGFGAPMTPGTRQHSRQPHPWRAYQGQHGSTCAPQKDACQPISCYEGTFHYKRYNKIIIMLL